MTNTEIATAYSIWITIILVTLMVTLKREDAQSAFPPDVFQHKRGSIPITCFLFLP